MKLNLSERIVLLDVLPARGNYETMATIEKLTAALRVSEEEQDKHNFKQDGTRVSFDPSGLEQVEVELSARGLAFLITVLTKKDKEEDLTLPAYEMFKRLKEEVGE